MPDDFRVSITNASGKKAYPIASFTWLLIPAKFRGCSEARCDEKLSEVGRSPTARNLPKISTTPSCPGSRSERDEGDQFGPISDCGNLHNNGAGRGPFNGLAFASLRAEKRR